MNNNNIKNTFERFAPSKEQKEKIYEYVAGKQRSGEEKAKLPFSLKLVYVLGSCLIMAAAAAAVLSSPRGESPVSSHEPYNAYQANRPSEDSTLPATTEEGSLFGKFVLTAYSANGETEYLSADYEEQAQKAVLKPDVKILLAKYDPALSSVPGIPFTVDLTGEDKDIETITVSADGGGLCKWDRDTGVVSPEGYTTSIGKGETIYWSPIGGEASSSIKQITITFEAITGNTVIGWQSIYITQDEPGYYYATAGDLELV